MKTNKFTISILICLLVIILSGCKGKSRTDVQGNNSMTKEQLIRRGGYLVSSIGCGDCHSPKKVGPDGLVEIKSLMLSGYPSDAKLPPIDKKVLEQTWQLFNFESTAAAGPWGVSFAANITSDQSGIGSWPEEDFIRAMKQGKFKGMENARTLLPPMPWQDFANLTDDDVKAIYAFLITTTPVNNLVPAPIAAEDIQ